MGSAKKKLTWKDVDELAFLLIDKYPAQDATRLSLEEIKEMVMALPSFSVGKSKKVDPAVLEVIQTTWAEEREEMEDELGPVGTVREDPDNINEDEFRDDLMLDELTGGMSGSDDDEDEKDDFEDGFQTGDEDDLH